jgi:hypothetical protein
MITWSIIESVLQAGIMKQLNIDARKTVIVTANQQFYPRMQMLCKLLKIEGDRNKEAISILNKIEGYAKRNSLVHGLIIVGVPGELTFVKHDGNTSSRETFNSSDFLVHITGLTNRINRVQELLGISDQDIQRIVDAAMVI